MWVTEWTVPGVFSRDEDVGLSLQSSAVAIEWAEVWRAWQAQVPQAVPHGGRTKAEAKRADLGAA